MQLHPVLGLQRRAQAARRDPRKCASEVPEGQQDDDTPYEYPHPQYRFKDVPLRTRNAPAKGLRLRTIMVSDAPSLLRDGKMP